MPRMTTRTASSYDARSYPIRWIEPPGARREAPESAQYSAEGRYREPPALFKTHLAPRSTALSRLGRLKSERLTRQVGPDPTPAPRDALHTSCCLLLRGLLRGGFLRGGCGGSGCASWCEMREAESGRRRDA